MPEITPYLPGILAAYAILFVGASSPGPSVALLIGMATEQGRSPALVATLGIAFGSMTINILTLLGVGLILSQSAWAISLLRFAAAAYLLYLAYSAFKKAVHPPVLHSIKPVEHRQWRQFCAGYFLQITNPKAISFWLAIASVGAVEHANTSIVVAYIVGAFIISFVCHGFWAIALSLNQIRLLYIAWRRWIETTLGCFFVFFSYNLINTQR